MNLTSSNRNLLVGAWVDIYQRTGMPLRVVVDLINADHGTHYRPQRLMDWRNGAVDPPRAIADMMRRELLAYLLGDKVAAIMSEVLGLSIACGP